MVKKQPENYLIRTAKKHDSYYKLAEDFIERMLSYTKIETKKLKESIGHVKESDDNFSCDGCGKCCDMGISDMAPDVYQEDMHRWMAEDFGMALVSLGLAARVDSEPNLYIDRKEDYISKAKFHTVKYADDIVRMNPSLALITPKEKQQCVFFNSLDNKCTIYVTRPIGCRAFPYAMDDKGKLSAYKKFCPPAQFSKGKVEKWEDIAKIVEITWANINGLKVWIKNRVGSAVFKDVVPEAHNKKSAMKAMAVNKSKSKQKGVLTRFYENLIATFYLLYPEYTNVGEITKEMAKPR